MRRMKLREPHFGTQKWENCRNWIGEDFQGGGGGVGGSQGSFRRTVYKGPKIGTSVRRRYTIGIIIK